MRSIALLCLSLFVFVPLIGGCNLIYKQNVQQGNSLEQEDIDLLELGMTRRQVLVVLGSPALQDPFHNDRWDYIYTFERRGKPVSERSLTLMFENDSLVSIEGDVQDPDTEEELDAKEVAVEAAEEDAREDEEENEEDD